MTNITTCWCLFAKSCFFAWSIICWCLSRVGSPKNVSIFVHKIKNQFFFNNYDNDDDDDVYTKNIVYNEVLK